MVNLSVDYCGLKLSNPIIAASGTFGFGREFNEFYDINILGSFVTKGMTAEKRYGNAQPRIADCKSGMLNSVGLQNNGADHIAKYEFDDIKDFFHKPVIANICGFLPEEYIVNAKTADKADVVGMIELNVSCPNVTHGGMSFGTDPNVLYSLVSQVKKAVKKPLIVKLSPNVSDIASLAQSAEQAGADGISLINTVLGAKIDIKTKKFVLANKYGGYSGQGIFPIAVRMVSQVYNAVKIPILGMGGICSAEDVLEMMMAGATAVQIGTANLIDPYASKKIIENLSPLCEKLNITNIADIIGIANKQK